MLRQGVLKRLTKDHSFVQFLVDKGIITDIEAESHPRKNEITTAIGIEESIEAETCIAPLELFEGDKLLLCSDGLNSMINDNEIAKILNNSSLTLEQQSKKLVEAALNAGGYDNITVQLIEI
jgi:protein phosphatase